jgi:capsular polysaccharide transport system permease protein
MTQNVQIDYSKLRPVSKQMPFATFRTVMAMVLREMTATYGRTPGGYIWAIIEPVGGIVMMSVIFAVFLRTPPLGTNFAIFYATGLLPFSMFLVISQKVSQSLTYSRQLLAYPRVTIIDALAARFLLNFVTQIIVITVLFTGIRAYYDTGTVLILPRIILACLMAGSLGAGIGVLNCFLILSFPAWNSIWGVITRPLMLVSGALYVFMSIPLPWRDYIWFNPLVHVIGMMRSAFYVGYDDSYVSPTYVFAVSLITGVLGLLFLRRYYRDLRD